MNVLVINPNTTNSVTDKLVDQAIYYLPEYFNVVGMTATEGPSVVRCESDVKKAEQAIDAMLAGIDPDVDALILGISLDIGLSELRQHLQKPVFALSESTLRHATNHHDALIAITIGTHMLPLYAEMSARYGYSSTQVHWIAIDDLTAFAPEGLTDGHKRAFVQQAVKLKEQHPKASVAFFGALLAGLGEYASEVLPGIAIVEPMHAVCLDLMASISSASGEAIS